MLSSHSSGWEKAIAAARKLQDNGISRAVRRFYLTVFPLVAAGSLLIGFLMGLFVSNLQLRVTLTLGLMGLAVMVSGSVYSSKKVNPLVPWDSRPVAHLINKGEEQRARRQIVGSLEADGDEAIVARGLAIQGRTSLASQLMVGPGALLIFLPQVFVAEGPYRWFSASLVVVFTASIAFVGWRFHQTTVFLRSTAASST